MPKRRILRRGAALPAVLMLAVLMLSDPSGFCALTVLAALLHEGGHLLAAWALRIPIKGLRLSFLGARLDAGGRLLSFGEEWLLSAAGPFASLVLAALAAVFWEAAPALRLFSCASLLLGLLNLLPIKSFDGGRMLECALMCLLPEAYSRRLMRLCSFFFLFLFLTAE